MGPFVLEGGLPSGDTEGVNEDEEEEEDSDQKAAKDLAAAELSAEKLSKLQPLPKLLSDFDLDTHVGLIQRLLKVDPKLVEMHSRLSSGGQREVIFWKNYFFHCAYTRYEAGLSIDEIWSNEHRPSPSVAVAEESEDFDVVNEPDEEVIFDSSSGDEELSTDRKGDTVSGADISAVNDTRPSTIAATVTPQTSKEIGGSIESAPSSPQRDTTTKSAGIITPSDSAVESGGGTDYEFVSSTGGDEDDGEMDELQAEIAAALDD